jgi:hypothetical protein
LYWHDGSLVAGFSVTRAMVQSELELVSHVFYQWSGEVGSIITWGMRLKDSVSIIEDDNRLRSSKFHC